MKLISWNVAGRTAILPAQAAAHNRELAASRRPDRVGVSSEAHPGFCVVDT